MSYNHKKEYSTHHTFFSLCKNDFFNVKSDECFLRYPFSKVPENCVLRLSHKCWASIYFRNPSGSVCLSNVLKGSYTCSAIERCILTP